VKVWLQWHQVLNDDPTPDGGAAITDLGFSKIRSPRVTLRRRLFQIWCALTALWWLGAVFGNGSLILIKFTLGGWHAAFVPFVVTLIIAVGVPVAILLAGWIVTLIVESLAGSARSLK